MKPVLEPASQARLQEPEPEVLLHIWTHDTHVVEGICRHAGHEGSNPEQEGNLMDDANQNRV